MWTSTKCLTEHDKNKVYQIVNIDVPIGYLNSRISYLTMIITLGKNRKILYTLDFSRNLERIRYIYVKLRGFHVGGLGGGV